MDINEYTDQVGFGQGADKTKIESDGTIKMEGQATVWDDIQHVLIGQKLYSTSGKIDYDWDENAIKFQSGGSITNLADRLAFSIQYPHAAKTNGDFRLHIHWEQDDSYANKPIQFTIKYRVQSNGSAKTDSWQTAIVECSDTNNVFKYGSGTLNQITKLVNVDMTGASISAVVDVIIARTDSSTGDILGKFIDFHYEKTTLGSRTEYTK